MGWDQGFGGPLIRVHIHAVVNVDRSGQTYSGTFNALESVETDMTHPFQEAKNCMPTPPGTMTGVWAKPD